MNKKNKYEILRLVITYHQPFFYVIAHIVSISYTDMSPPIKNVIENHSQLITYTYNAILLS